MNHPHISTDNERTLRACLRYLIGREHTILTTDATGPQPRVRVMEPRGLDGALHVMRPDRTTYAANVMGCTVVWDVPRVTRILTADDATDMRANMRTNPCKLVMKNLTIVRRMMEETK